LEKALAEAQTAYELSPQNLYLLQQGDCQFALKNYLEAYEIYTRINQTTFASAKTFFYASKAREKYDNDSTIVIALLDSALARFSKPYSTEAGPYLWQRAQLQNKYGHYREAAIDYDTYEKLYGVKKLNDNFYYIKEQNDMSARLYSWALNDIEKALLIKPGDYAYTVEKALIQLHVGNNEEAIFTAEEAIKINPKGADAYKILGIAYGQTNKKQEAIRYLKKAKELGDPQDIDEWISELQKK